VIKNKKVDSTKKYIRDGYAVLEPSFSEVDLEVLKKEIISCFEDEKQKEIMVKDIKKKNIDAFKKIIKIIYSKETQQFFEKLSNFYNKKISILPQFLVMKNYHVNRLTTKRIGWHRDCALEFEHEYSSNALRKNDYVFGKMGIFFQNNSENYGGAVDLIPGSHKYIKKNNKFLQIINSLRLHMLIFFNKKFPNLYKLIPEKIYNFFLGAKKINPKIGSPIIFDSRLQHRGSTVNEKYLAKSDQLGEHFVRVPDSFTKIGLYCYYGSMEGADAHLYGQINRKEGHYKKIFSAWKNESEIYKDMDENLYKSMMSVINSLESRYKDC
jgi:hypothetical protein